MKSKLHVLSLLLALVAFNACNRDLSPLNTASTSFPPPPTPSPCALAPDPYMWFDFETDPSSYWWWPGGPSPMVQSWANGVAHTGCRSWKLVTSAGSGYGHWNGLSMGATTPPGTPAGMTQVQISIQINGTLTTTIYFDEGTSNGGQGQEWSRSVTFTNTAGSFVTYTYPLSSFSTTDPGDSILNTQDAIQFWFYHSAPYSSHTLYIDDIRLIP